MRFGSHSAHLQLLKILTEHDSWNMFCCAQAATRLAYVHHGNCLLVLITYDPTHSLRALTEQQRMAPFPVAYVFDAVDHNPQKVS